MTYIAVVRLALIRGVQMRVENFQKHSVWHPYSRTSHSLAHVPVAPEECCRSAIQRIPEHVTLLNWPPGQDGKSASENAGVVEFAIGQHIVSLSPDGSVVAVGPTFLQANDIKVRRVSGKSAAYLRQSSLSVGGEVF